MTVCEINTDQKWEITSQGFIKSVIGGRKCIDVKPSGELQLEHCEEWSDPANFLDWKWVMTPDGRIQNQKYLQCIDVQGDLGVHNFRSIDLWKCEHNTNADQV